MSNTTTEYVTEVIDGDTFKTKEDDKNVRLKDVWAEEKGHKSDKDEKATEHLKSLVLHKKVEIEQTGTTHDRRESEVKVDGRSVNQAMRDYIKTL